MALRHIVDVGHIGVELRLGAEIGEYEGQQGHCRYDRAGLVGFERGDAVKQLAALGLVLLDFHQLRQAAEHEDDGADEQQGGEDSKVAQGCRLQGNQRQEGSYGGDVADDQRARYLPERLLDVGVVRTVDDEVERVVHRYAEYDAGDAYHNDGDTAAENRDARHRKEPAPAYRQEDEQDIAQRADGEAYQQDDEQHRKADGKDAVFLDAGGVADGDLGAADQLGRHSGEGIFHLGDDSAQKGQQAAVTGSFAAAEG